MEIANNLDLGGMGEGMIEGHDLTVVVEWSKRNGLPSGQVNEAIHMEHAIGADHVERSRSEDDLNVRIEHAVVVGQLEASLQGKRFSAPNVSQPDEHSSDSGTGPQQGLLTDRVAAHILIAGWMHYARWQSTIEINGAIDGAGVVNRAYRVRS